MAITIEKKFQVDSKIEDVWSFIANPARVAPCLPGVELTNIIDDVTYAGNVRVKVGPMTVAYAGEAQVTERDDSIRTFKMVGKGKEKGGAGSAKMELMATLIEVDGGVEVGVKSTIDLTGRVVRFGRGMIEAVSDQLFEEFVRNLRANLESEKKPASVSPTDEAAGVTSPPTAEEVPVQSEPLTTQPSLDVPPLEQVSPMAPLAPAEPPLRAADVPSVREPPSDALAVSKSPSSLAPASKPVAALPLLIKVLLTMFKRVWSRLFGGKHDRRA